LNKELLYTPICPISTPVPDNSEMVAVGD